jgi:hypothetical protein
MSVPARLRIAWEDEDTLRLDTDAGQQSRAFHFGAEPPANLEASWQGFSQAEWRIRVGGMEPGSEAGGSLEVTIRARRRAHDLAHRHQCRRGSAIPYSTHRNQQAVQEAGR